MADFDFIVVGSGMSGGWVAKELCERGFKVAVVERGRELKPEVDYTDFEDPWQHDYLNMKWSDHYKKDYPIQSEVYAFHSYTKQFWVKDTEHPYETAPGTDYRWRRGYHTGGRSIMWARQSYRLSPVDFDGPNRDGFGAKWPVKYDDLDPWYSYVEKFAGISGSEEGLEILPDSVFQPPHDLTCAEEEFRDKVEAAFPGRRVIPGRCANLTEPTQEQLELGRGKCQARDHCFRGCSFGAYFSSMSATLPAARRTGNLTLISDVAVHKVSYDEAANRVTGIEGVNVKTNEPVMITGDAVFLNASALASALILLNSKSEKFPNGLANSSGHVGHNLMDHTGGASGAGIMPGFEDKHHFGRRPNGFYIPRYRNYGEDGDGYIRGFGFQGAITRQNWGSRVGNAGVGAEYKDKVSQPGPWTMWIGAFGEVLPRFENHVRLHETKTDKWGFPIPVMDARNSDNELKMMQQAARDIKDMMEAAGMTVLRINSPENHDQLRQPGDAIHEMGTLRMGDDPTESVLNGWNQSHDIPNLFNSDGGFMTSSACQNPSLTYMAFSARAANHAADLKEEGAL